MSLLSLANLTQHVSFPTHRHLHTLDLVITTVDSLLSPVITHTVNSPSDHFPVFSSLNITPPKPSPLSKHSFRRIKSINIHSFILDILSSTLITRPPSNLSDLVDCYNSTLSSLLNKHAPVITKTLRFKPSNPWFTPVLHKLKLARRRLERIWSHTHSSDDLLSLHSATNKYHAAIIKAKRDYNSKLISSNLTNCHKLWNTVNSLLHRKSLPALPASDCLKSLSQSFATFSLIKFTNFTLAFFYKAITVHLMLILHLNLLIFLTFILPLLKKSLNFCLNHLLPTVILILFLLHLLNNVLLSY
jgi:hypothetical protein